MYVRLYVHVQIWQVRMRRSTAATQTLSRVTSMQDLIKSRVLIYCLPVAARGGSGNSRRCAVAARGELEASRETEQRRVASFVPFVPTLRRVIMPSPSAAGGGGGGSTVSLSSLVQPKITGLFRASFIMKYDILRFDDSRSQIGLNSRRFRKIKIRYDTLTKLSRT